MIPITQNNHYNSEDSALSESPDQFSLTVPELKEKLRALPDGMILNICLESIPDSGGNINGKI